MMVIQKGKEGCDKENECINRRLRTGRWHGSPFINKWHLPISISVETTILPKTKLQLSDKLRDRLVFYVCLICIFLFLYTAYSKITDHQRFLKGLLKVTIIGGAALYISWLVPAAEVLISILLIIPKTNRWGLMGFTGLMTLFTGYILSMVLWAEKLPCHCGGAIEKLSWTQHIWFNLAFIALAAFALWISQSKTNT